jgi:triosephosphate isomerase
MRTPIIAGNWKMNKTPTEAKALVAALIPLVAGSKTEVVVCPTAICLQAVKEAIAGTNIKLGAQNMYFKDSGAFTGEISPLMLKDLGVEYVILGHSERRQYFAETDDSVNEKAKAALAHGIKPIICVGESLAQREKGVTNEVVSMQTKLALQGISQEDAVNVVIAYEPIWAIGTGKTATNEEANETIGVIRNTVAQVYGNFTAHNVRIQYGGSMNAGNAAGLMAQPEIDGGLIGGASLKAEDFSKIVNF